MLKVVTAEEMRRIEADTVRRGIPLIQLMTNAADRLAECIRDVSHGGPILILVGPGNNGADGVLAAARLHAEGRDVTIYSYRRSDYMGFAGRVTEATSDAELNTLTTFLEESDVVVDALFGIGQSRMPDRELAGILRCVNAGGRSRVRIAVDIPTGVFADTGAVSSEAFRADLCVAMGYLKRGHVTGPGSEFCGTVRVVDVGIPDALAENIQVEIHDDVSIAHLLPSRRRGANKGSSGRLLLVGGSREFLGAPALASIAAYRMGAGLVEVAVPVSAQAAIAAHALEPIYCPLPESEGHISVEAVETLLAALKKAGAVTFGSGMGLSEDTVSVTQAFLTYISGKPALPAVIDADGLNVLAQTRGWWKHTLQVVVTPHPGEMSRLTGLSIREIENDRIEVAMRHAKEWGVVVVLKGAGTVVASPTGEIAINPTGGPNLATAGTGDVLAGIIGGLLTQGVTPYDAGVIGAYLHGKAGDILRDSHGDVGTIASDLLHNIPVARLKILGAAEE